MVSRTLLLLAFLPLAAHDSQAVFEVTSAARQGETLRVTAAHAGARVEGASARFAGKSVPLFPQPDGRSLALMPVPVTQKPGEHVLEVLDRQGKSLHRAAVWIEDARFPRQNIRVSKGMATLQPGPGEMETVRGLQNLVSPERYWREPFLSPTPDCINSPFGVSRYHNGKFTGNYHRGVDLRSPQGRPVRATADGVVRIARMFRLHGGTAGLDHGQGVTSTYIHLSKISVREGDRVGQGDVIGYVGATGFATGPHLHWGLYVNGLPVNPAQWIPDVERCP